MGKRGKNNRGRGRGGGRGGGGGGRGPTTNYPEIKKENEAFERYYNRLEIVKKDELDQFWTTLRRELPNSFRFTGSKGHALSVQQRLKDLYIPEITGVKFNGQLVDPPKQLSWYPEQLAWQMTVPKQVIRKFAPFASFQKFLVSETQVGNISRQEVVSMIPPLLMDIKPGMTVLDLCAAPGSKSAQLAEMVHGGEEARVRKVLHKLALEQGREMSPDGREIEVDMTQAENEDDYQDDGRSTGLLIANDVDNRRAHMLVHQVKRLNSPNLIVTNHDATMYPSIEIESEPGKPKRYLKFDRILADVPCSGDGTARKNPGIWKDWNAANGLGLHALQGKILVRALQMLKKGGRVVYSTCSLNPMENEAVVARAIDRCGGTANVRIVDCSHELPGLIRREGLTHWPVMDKAGRFWDTWDEVERHRENVGEEGLSRIAESMFPLIAATEDERIPLERCMRVYPHDQDTGGFFICVLEKLNEIRAKPEAEPKNPTTPSVKQNGDATPKPSSPIKRELEEDIDGQTDGPASPKRVKVDHNEEPEHENGPLITQSTDSSLDIRMDDAPPKTNAASGAPRSSPKLKTEQPFKKRSSQPQEEPFKYLDPEHVELQKVYEFYNISPRFPRGRWMVRNGTGEPVKAIYYTSALAREILVRMEGKGMKFVHCGVKMFMKQDAQGHDTCRWRIQSDGLPIIEPWVGEERIVRLYKKETLRKLLIEMFPQIAKEGWTELGEIGERVRDIPMGCCVLRVETSDDEDGFKERMVVPLWRSVASLNLMLPKEERKALLLRLFNDDTPLIDHSKERFNKPKTEDAPTSVLRGGADPEEMNTDAVKAEDTEFPEMDADPDTLDKEIDDGIDGGVPLE